MERKACAKKSTFKVARSSAKERVIVKNYALIYTFFIQMHLCPHLAFNFISTPCCKCPHISSVSLLFAGCWMYRHSCHAMLKGHAKFTRVSRSAAGRAWGVQCISRRLSLYAVLPIAMFCTLPLRPNAPLSSMQQQRRQRAGHAGPWRCHAPN